MKVRAICFDLDNTLYRDDLDFKPPRALEETSIPEGGIDQALVILVDDVLYTGRSVRAALDALRDIGRPKAVQDLADLVESFGGAELMDVIRMGEAPAATGSEALA